MTEETKHIRTFKHQSKPTSKYGSYHGKCNNCNELEHNCWCPKDKNND